MTRNRVVTLVVAVVFVAVGSFLVRPLMAAGCGSAEGCKPEMTNRDNHTGTSCRPPGQPVTAEQLSAISKSIDLAIRNLEAGKTASALAELRQAKALIAKLRSATKAPAGKAAGPKFVNTRCPIMGSPIDPAKVPDSLTRDYKGRKVAFCCGGCPGEWDKLTDQEKAAKLEKANAAR